MKVEQNMIVVNFQFNKESNYAGHGDSIIQIGLQSVDFRQKAKIPDATITLRNPPYFDHEKHYKITIEEINE